MPPKKEMRTEDTYLVGTDDQVQWLLETRDFEAKKVCAGIDCESIKDKTFLKPLCQIYPNRQAVKNVRI